MKIILNKIALLLAFICATSSFAFSGQWSLNDVTYVFPLPVNETVQNTLPVLTTLSLRDGKPLLDLQIYNQIFSAYSENMTALAIRIDPCFRDQFTDSCRRQIRIVWQPLTRFNQKITTVDAALHTFYDLSANEFNSLLNELQALKQKYSIKTDQQPLWTHPGFEKDRETPFQQEFLRAILSKIGFSNTSRIAVMRMGMMRKLWEFQSYDVQNGIVRGTTIFNSNEYYQRFINMASLGEYSSNGTLTTAAKNEGADQLFKVMDDSTNPALQNVDTLKLYLGRAIKLEQPTKHLPGTTDCISCHAANGVKVWAANKLIRQGVMVDLSKKPDRHNYLNRSRLYGPTTNFRALGYSSDQIQISDRIINESASVADWLNQKRL